MKISVALLFLFICLTSVSRADAGDEDDSENLTATGSVGKIVAVGLHSSFLQTEQQQRFSQNAPLAMLGLQFETWTAQLEYSSVTTSSSSGNVQISNRYEEILSSYEYSVPLNEWLAPLVGVGIGANRNRADLAVGDSTDVGAGTWQLLTSFNFGVRVIPMSHWWISAEERVQHSRLYAPNPELNAIFKIGYEFF